MSATPAKGGFAKRYKELAARSRVPLGFLLLVVYAIFSRPSRERLIAGSLVALCGLALRAWATGHLDKNRELCTGGPYAHTRNPLYLGTLLVAAGLAVASRELWLAVLFAAAFGLIYLPAIELEEQHLRALFPEYAAYASQVPRLGVRLRPSVSPERFRLALYRKNQEYQAAAGYLVGLALLAWKISR